jgi:hypothetical protein
LITQHRGNVPLSPRAGIGAKYADDRSSDMRVKAFVIALLLVAALAVRSSASCAVFEVTSAFRDAKAVFVGQVLSTRVGTSPTDPIDVSTVATILVLQRWKGPETATLEVGACGGGDVVCTVSMDFQIGRRYVFFAEGTPLSTSSCMSREVERASAELRWLRNKPSTKPG